MQKRERNNGITLLELMAAIVIIGVFFALAAPGFASLMNDRHTQRAAEDLTGMLRRARMRAAATGAAHMVRIRISGNAIKISMHAAVNGTAAVSSCLSPTWSGTGSSTMSGGTFDHRLLESIDFSKDAYYGNKNILVAGPEEDFCFTPGGALWYRTPSTLFTRGQGPMVVQYQFERKDSLNRLMGLRRIVRIGASGLPALLVES